MAAAMCQSDYEEAEDTARAAAEAICDLAVPLLRHTPVSTVGLGIFAQALLATQEVRGDLLRGHQTYFSALGIHLARALAVERSI